MSIIIRLQNLPWAANSVDIRRYFNGLSIPEGGVHIVGGEKGDAFIAFSTDEDARQAMQKDGGKIKDMQIKLFLSSRTEMMRVIEQARQMNMTVQAPAPVRVPVENDRRRTRDRSPMSPSRRRGSREREKSPSRDRHRSPDRRRRDRSRSSSPDRRSRDVDRRNDRFGRSEHFEDSSRYRDDRRSQHEPKFSAYADNDRNDDRRSENFGGRPLLESNRKYNTPNAPYYDNQQQNNYSYPPQQQPVSESKILNDLSLSSFGITNFVVPSNDTSGHSGGKNMFPYEPRNSPTRNNVSTSYASSSGHVNKPYDQGAPVGRQVANSESYDKPRKRSRFEPEFSSPPFFDPASEEAKKSVPRQSHDYSAPQHQERNRYPRREGWSSRDKEMSENKSWNDTRPVLLESPPKQKVGRDFGQTSARDMNEKRNRMMDAPKQEPYHRPAPNLDQHSSRPPANRPPDERHMPDHRPPHNLPQGGRPHGFTAEIRGLPPDIRQSEVLDLFLGISVPEANIKLPLNSHGQLAGVGFVRFLSSFDHQEALSRSGRFIRKSRIEIIPCPPAAFEAASKAMGNAVVTPPSPLRVRKPRPREEDLCVRLRGLPFACKEEDVAKFFDGLSIVDMFIDIGADGRATGTGYVEFGSTEDFQASLARGGKMIRHRYIAIAVASKEMMEMSRNRELNDEPVDPRKEIPARPFQQTREPSLCVALKGLPENITNSDVGEFFKEVGLVPRAIHIMLRPNKMPSGDAYVEFGDQHEHDIALGRNGNRLLNRRVSVTPISFNDMSEVLGRRPGPPPQPLLGNAPIEPAGPRPIHDQGGKMLRPEPNSMQIPPQPPFPRMRGPGPLRPGMRPPRPPFGENRFPHRMPGPMMRKGGPMPRNLGPPHLPRNPGPPRNMGPPPRMPGPRNADPGSMNSAPVADAPSDFGSPGCVVAINNLHYKAGLEELLEFFSNYSLTKDSIIRKYNEKGQTTGEARVAFQNPRDAQRAVRELNQLPIMGRTIKLSLV